MNKNPADTKTKILDAAEKLFGENGFDATSLRDITQAADVNLAAVNYHFQSKDSLIDAVIARRIEPVNRQRLALLDAAGPDPTVEQILIAFFEPVFNQDLTCIAPLMGRILATPGMFIVHVFQKHMIPISKCFTEALAAALPEHPRAEIVWRLQFTAGAMAHVLARATMMSQMTGGVCDPGDRQAVVARLITFSAAGFRAAEES
ncbi:MAG: TetR/AcrR family transcriptional regulator [Bryobacteraceae bacterium]